MKLTLLVTVLLISGCAGPDRADRLSAVRYRIDDGPTLSAESFDELHGTPRDRQIDVWFTLPARPHCSDPAILVDYANSLAAADVDGEPLRTTVRPRGLIPVRPEHAGRTVHLVFRGVVSRTQGRLFVGCQRELATAWISLDVVQFVIGSVQVVVGALVLAAFFWRRRAAYAWLGLFVLTTGIVFVNQSPGFRNLLFANPLPLAWLRDVCCFVYTFAFARFAIDVFGDTRARFFTWLARVALGSGAVAVGLDALGLVALTRTTPLSQLIALASLPAVVAMIWQRSRRGDRAARRFLWGTLGLIVFATPDLMWGMGLPYHFAFNTAPIGLLLFVSAMGSIIEMRFEERSAELSRTNRELEHRLRELEAKTREVVGLNTELRHQIGQHARDIGRALAATGTVETLGLVELTPGIELGRYRVIEKLGSGAMGSVYRVERTTDGATFALKVMAAAASPELAARFAREAEVAAKVSHENVVSIADVGVLDSGVPFLVMELVRGHDLERERARFGDRDWALGILAQVAAGLEALHARGVVHRDLKPANVLLAIEPERTRAKLADFGIAREHDVTADATLTPSTRGTAGAGAAGDAPEPSAKLTQTGALIGTPLYMAPELGRGARATPAADVFSFGIVLYELLTGRYPFDAPPAFTTLAGLPLPAPAALPESVPEEVRDLVVQALLPSPERRPSARILALALERYRDGQ